MKIRILFSAMIVLLVMSCSKDQDLHTFNQNDPLTHEELSKIIEDQLFETNEPFDWNNVDAHATWSALIQSDSILAIGYKAPGITNTKDIIHTLDQTSGVWKETRDLILNQILEAEQKHRNNPKLTIEELLPFGLDDKIPSIEVQITDPNLVTELKANDEIIRYVEAMGFELKGSSVKSSSGCSGSPDYNINSNDYTTVAPGTKVPWNFYNHNINDAWNISQGDNISICIIDTGASDNQDNLGSQFTSGYSGGRFIHKYSTHYSGRWWWRSLDSPHDQCGHGTSMAGLAAAPRGTDGNATGSAYKANLVTIRAVEDVVISSSNEKKGVRDALILAGNRNDVKVISMSIGSPLSSSTVKDGIYYAWNKGKMMMAAAGTSTTVTNWVGVIFPANMNETVAITGIRDGSGLQRCNTCHSGSKVDFVVEMQRQNNTDRNSLSLALSTNQPKYISGSSAATATSAGIAAMTWATNPGMSRLQVMTRLKNASQLYPNRDSQYGWGRLDAYDAVTGN